jgi:hypothetical protein
MKRWLKRFGISLLALVLAGSGLVVWVSYNQAKALGAPARNA